MFRDHLLRLDGDSRRMRFGHAVSNAFVEDYVARTDLMASVVYGAFHGEGMHAAAELRKLGESWGQEAEAAFSVERTHQDLGIGTELMGRIIKAARNRGVHHLFMSCLAENGKMQAIARKYDAELRFENGDVIGEILPAFPSYASILEEAIEDGRGYMMAVLDIRRKLASRAA
jgi:GNAT superfamily N-acetyltransferase